MDQKLAQNLFQNGAVFIFLAVPEGTEFGIDMKSWNTGEKFRGVKMIPPGVHFVFYSPISDTTGDVAPRSGFFYNFRKGEVLVRKWDKRLEDLSPEKVSEDEVKKLTDSLEMLDGFLGPYPYDILEKWKGLSANITDSLIKKMEPESGIIRSALELEGCTNETRPRGGLKSVASGSRLPRLSNEMSVEMENSLLPNLTPRHGTEIRFSQFPEQNYPIGASPAEITRHSLDSTFVLEQLIKNTAQEDILGELEFCYICFLVGHSLEAFEQWKRVINLLCSCEAAIQKYRKIYDLLIDILQVQIPEVPEEFLADIVDNNNFIYVKLKILFRNISESSIDGQLKSKVDRFQKKLTKLYLWDFNHLESEDDEDAPVVVEL